MNNKYMISFIDGHDLRYKTTEISATDEKTAVNTLFELYGDFDHQIIGVTVSKSGYNYGKAAKLWDLMTGILFDMPDYYDTENRQKERRCFMHALTRNNHTDKNIYLDMITDYVTEFATDEEKTELEKVALSIMLFTNETV